MKMDGKYQIVCRRCGRRTSEDVNQRYCPVCKKKGLLYTTYSTAPKMDDPSAGLYRYMDLLPVHSRLPGVASLPGCFRSENLSLALGLENLWILFSGYWPEKKAYLESGSFKELEAIGVLSRMAERSDKVMMLSSAGNTGLSTIFISLKTGIPAIVVAPETACSTFLTPLESRQAPVFLISLKQASYRDCILFAAELERQLPGVTCEGGVYNIARRDFLGLPVLHAVHTIKEIPDHYFQAVGSGTGAIAAWEACKKLSCFDNGRCHTMHLHLAQNKPFTPIVDAWNRVTGVHRSDPESVLARVLTNPDPPYWVAGGIHDAMTSANGYAYGVDNNEILDAKFTFETLEGIDIQYPSAAAVAALKKAVKKGRVAADDLVLLHITGGGRQRLEWHKPLYRYPAALSVHKTRTALAVQGISGFLERIGHTPNPRKKQNE